MHKNVVIAVLLLIIINNGLQAEEVLNPLSPSQVEQIVRKATEGDSEYQARLGYMYYVGEGVKQNLQTAILWYRRAAVQGNKDAQYNIGVAYAFGEGVEQNLETAAEWYRRAAIQGHAQAQFSLGLNYTYGEGVKQNYEEAATWFERAAHQGYDRAQLHLAGLYYTGTGVLKNLEKAVQWYRKAADRGNPVAQYNLGNLYHLGQGVKQDYTQARHWYQLAADQGYVAALNPLSNLERIMRPPKPTVEEQVESSPQADPEDPALAKKFIEETEEPVVETADEEKTILLTVDEDSLLSLPDEANESVVETPTAEEIQSEDETTLEIAESTPVEIKAESKMATSANTDYDPAQEVPKRGFFQRLFGRKTAETAKQVTDVTETPRVVTIKSEDEMATSANTGYEVPIEIVAESTPVEIKAESKMATPANTDYDPTQEVPKRGFFQRLFGRKTAEIAKQVTDVTETPRVVTIKSEDEMATSANTGYEVPIEIVAESTPVEIKAESKMATPANTDYDPAQEVPKRGFFQRLFGRKTAETAKQVTDITETPRVVTIKSEDEMATSANTGYEDAIAEPQMATLPSIHNAIKSGEYDWALKQLHPSTDKGNPKAKSLLASMYYIGQGVRQNYYKAFDLYQQAAKQGNVDAQYALGNMYLLGEGIEEDVFLASEWYRKAAKQGHQRASNNLKNLEKIPSKITSNQSTGKVAELEDNANQTMLKTEKDEFIIEYIYVAIANGEYDQALKQLHPPAEQGNAKAQTLLASMYYIGQGVRQNYQKAFELYQQAAEKGNVDAQYALGNMYLLGEGIQEDAGLASEWYRKAAEQGHEEAAKNLENIVKSNHEKADTEIGQIEQEADSKIVQIEQETDAALLDNQLKEQTKLEAIHIAIEKGENEQAFTELSLLADQGDTDALTILASMYYIGQGVRQNYQKAFELYQQAAEKGNVDAQYALGNMYLLGEGTKEDIQLAKNWYMKASEQGHIVASKNLKKLE